MSSWEYQAFTEIHTVIMCLKETWFCAVITQPSATKMHTSCNLNAALAHFSHNLAQF